MKSGNGNACIKCVYELYVLMTIIIIIMVIISLFIVITVIISRYLHYFERNGDRFKRNESKIRDDNLFLKKYF